MEKLFQSNLSKPPKVSLILLDWSCRESFHSLKYLNTQTAPRDQYEILWIEYYDRRSPEIREGLKECEKQKQPPIVDQWLVMDMPANVYYHKHLMYNIGISFSRGKIVTICDSDAIFEPTFIENIINSFEENKNIILHLDQIRNINKKFYPFNYPTTKELLREGCINYKDGKTTGILDDKDPLHTRNYGSCMCALREDLINIGGADEYIDYLGHVCGPYDMTFRLINSGKKEIWHSKEFLYHTWHKGTDGKFNYIGPHDGKNMSTTALEARKSGRVKPLVENKAIEMLRSGKKIIPDKDLMLKALPSREILKTWEINQGALKSIELAEHGWEYYFKAKLDEAQKMFDESLKIDSKNNYALRGQGWVFLQKKDYEKSLESFSKALECTGLTDKGAIKEIYRGLGWTNFHKGCFDTAINNFNMVFEDKELKDKGVLQDAFRGLGWSYYRKNNFDKARNNFNSAGKYIDPGEKELLQDVRRGLELADKGVAKRKLPEYDSPKSIHLNTKISLSKFDLPEIIEIEPTYMCNLRCIQCHTTYQKTPNTLIDPKFVKRLKNIKGKWALFGYNYEPMVHPKCGDIITGLSDMGLKIDLITNGTLLTKEISDLLSACDFFNIVISFDGIRKETYESIRKNASYERTIERIMYFKNRFKEKKPYFAINNTLMQSNIDEVIESIDFWEKHGFDHIGFIIMVLRDINEVLKKESLEKKMDYVYKEFLSATEHIIKNNYKITISGAGFNDLSELKAKYPGNFVSGCVKSNNAQAMTPFNPREFVQNGFYPGMPVACRSPFKSVQILYNGNVELCHQFPIGNIYDNDILDIWYGKKAQNVRNRLIREPKICHSCDYYRLCIKAGELDYSDSDSFYSELVHNKHRYPEVVETFWNGTYNIVAWLDNYYAIPQRLGPVDIVSDNITELEGVFVNKSIEKLKEAVTTKNHYAYSARGWVYFNEGNYISAINDLSKALEYVNPKNENALQEIYQGLGWACFKEGLLDFSFCNFLKAIEHTNPADVNFLQDFYRGIGWVSVKKGNFSKAEEYFYKAVKILNSENQDVLNDALNGLDVVHKALGGETENGSGNRKCSANQITLAPKVCVKSSESGFNEVQRLHVQRSVLLSNIAWDCYLQENYAEALNTFNGAIKIYPDNHSAYCGRGWSFLQKYFLNEAISDFNKVIAVNDLSKNIRQEAYRGRGWAYYRKGYFKEAIDDFDRALQYLNDNEKNAIGNIYQGRSWSFFRSGKFKDALNDFKKTNKLKMLPGYLLIHFLAVQVVGSKLKLKIRIFKNRFAKILAKGISKHF